MAQNGYLSQVTQQVRRQKNQNVSLRMPRVPKVVKSLFHSKRQSMCDSCSKSFRKNRDAVI